MRPSTSGSVWTDRLTSLDRYKGRCYNSKSTFSPGPWESPSRDPCSPSPFVPTVWPTAAQGRRAVLKLLWLLTKQACILSPSPTTEGSQSCRCLSRAHDSLVISYDHPAVIWPPEDDFRCDSK